MPPDIEREPARAEVSREYSDRAVAVRCGVDMSPIRADDRAIHLKSEWQGRIELPGFSAACIRYCEMGSAGVARKRGQTESHEREQEHMQG